MFKPLLFLVAIAVAGNLQGQEDTWPPAELSGAWKVKFEEYSENGVIQAPQARVWPSFFIFSGEYCYMLKDSLYICGVKLSAHETKDDGYFLLWPYHSPAFRMHLQKVAENEFRMVREEKQNNTSSRVVFMLSRIEKKDGVRITKELLADQNIHPTMRQFRDNAEDVLKEWMAGESK